MLPFIPRSRLTVSDVARQTGKTWEEVAKEKLITDMLCIGIALSAIAIYFM